MTAVHVGAAQAQCTSDVTREELEGFVAMVKPLGALKDVTSFSTQMNSQDGSTTSKLAGVATFDKRPLGFAMELVKVNGQWKIRQVQLDPSGKVPTNASP